MNMNQLSDFLLKLGGLHDATVVAIDWQLESRTLEFVLDDLYANFSGLPEYPGRHKAVIRLEGVSRIDFNVEVTERLRVFEILPAEDRSDEVVAKFSPGGSIRIRFASAVYPAALI
jgi:hypothetical protein